MIQARCDIMQKKVFSKKFVAVFLAGITATLFFAPCLSLSQSSNKPETKPEPKSETKPDSKPDKAKVEQPLELPEFVITGVESLDVPGGSKQAPKLPQKLTTSDLQRFNPLDKLSFSVLPQASMPRLNLPSQERSGFVKGEFGMFTTPSIDAGYRVVLGNFDLSANAGGIFSNGHLPNADFTDFYGQIASTYLAPEKFLLFGGSRTDTYIKARHRSYKFFGADNISASAIQRGNFTIAGGVQTIGNYEGWVYDMGADIQSLSSQTNEITSLTSIAVNTVVSGHLLGKKILGEWGIGGSMAAKIVLAGTQGTSQYLLSPTIVAEVRSAAKTFEAEIQGGVQVHSIGTAQGNTTTLVLPNININTSIHAGSVVSLTLNAFSGVRMNTLLNVVAENPYCPFFVSSSTMQQNPVLFPAVQPTWSLYDASLYARFQAHPSFSLTLGGRSAMKQNDIVFGANNRIGEIAVHLDTTSIHRFFAETAFFADSNNTITARFNAQFGSSVKFGAVPYLAPLEASLEYRRFWIPALSTVLTGVYMGERINGSVRSSESRIIPAFVDLRLNIEYRFSSQFSLYARGANLLNQPVFLWDGYQERGIFAALGAMLTF